MNPVIQGALIGLGIGVFLFIFEYMALNKQVNERAKKYNKKPEFDIKSVDVDGTDVAVQELVALEKPFCRLLRFKRYTDELDVLSKMKDQPTVLVVAPLSGHHATLLTSHHEAVTDLTDSPPTDLSIVSYRTFENRAEQGRNASGGTFPGRFRASLETHSGFVEDGIRLFDRLFLKGGFGFAADEA